MKSCKLITCFIASPNDVKEERESIIKVIEQINISLGLQKSFMVKPIRWEDAVPGFATDAQEVINKQLTPEESDIFIGIFKARMGTPTPRAESGSEEEVNAAIASFRNNRTKSVQVYFSNCPMELNKIDEDQFKKLKEFKERLGKEDGCLYTEYGSIDEFERKVRTNIETVLLQMVETLEGNETVVAKHTDVILELLKNRFYDALELFHNQKIEWVDRRLCEHNFYRDESLAHSHSKSCEALSLLDTKESCLICAPSLFGLTTLGYYLCYKAYEKTGKLWVYVDIANLGSKEDKILGEVSKWERLASRSASCIVLDSWSSVTAEGRKALEILETNFPKKRLVVLNTQSESSVKVAIGAFQPKRAYKIYHLLALTKHDLRKVVELSGGGINQESDVILEKIVRDMESLNVHRTPMNCLALLKVAEESFEKSPVNRTHMLETLLVVLFNIRTPPSHGAIPDAKDCEQILGAFCEYLLKNDQSVFTRKKFQDICDDICKSQLIGLDCFVLWDILTVNKIIVCADEKEYRFRSKFWICFFAAKRMEYDKGFYDYIFSEKRYTSYPEVVEFYTGIKRNETNILVLLSRDLEDTALQLKSKIGMEGSFNPYKGIRWSPNEREIEKIAKKLSASVSESAVPKEIKDQHADETYNHIKPYNQRIDKFLTEASFLAYINQVKSLSRALRNSDYADVNIRKQMVTAIISGWVEMAKVICLIAPILAQNGHASFLDFSLRLSSDFDSLKDDVRRLLFNILLVVPLNVLMIVKDDLASDRLGPLLEEIFRSTNDELKRHFIALFAVSERPAHWEGIVAEYVNTIGSDSYFLGKVFESLRYHYKFSYMSTDDLKSALSLLKACLTKRNFGAISNKESSHKFQKFLDEQIPERKDEDVV